MPNLHTHAIHTSIFPLLHKASLLMICLGIKVYGNESRNGQSYPNHLPRTAAAILRKWLGWIRDYQTQLTAPIEGISVKLKLKLAVQ